MQEPNDPFHYDDNLDISLIEKYEYMFDSPDEVYQGVVEFLKSFDEEKYKKKLQSELDDSLCLDEEEDIDFFQNLAEEKEKIDCQNFEHIYNFSMIQNGFLKNDNRSYNDLFNNNVEKRDDESYSTSYNPNSSKNKIENFSLSIQKNRLYQEYGYEMDFGIIANNSQNPDSSLRTPFNQNNKSSSTKDSSFNSKKNISNINGKKKLFNVINFDEFSDKKSDNSKNNSYLNNKRKREKELNTKIGDLIRTIFRKFSYYLKKNAKTNSEINSIKDKDPNFFKQLIKERRENAKKDGEILFDFGEKNKYKSPSQKMMNFIFSQENGKRLYEIFVKNNEKYFPQLFEKGCPEQRKKIVEYMKNFHILYGTNNK